MGYWCDRALVRSPLYVGLCLSHKDFHKELKGLGIPKAGWPDFNKTARASATTWFFSHQGKEIALVCVGSTKGRTKHQVYGLLVHEAVHIWQDIKKLIGEDSPSKEFEAYSVQWISQELMHGYEEMRRKK